MKNLEEVISRINIDKEILDTLPKNNAKNIKSYEKRVIALKEEYETEQKEIIKELEKRLKKISSAGQKKGISQTEKQIESNEGVLYLLNSFDTSYEKMDLDRAMFNLEHYYKKNLKIVNQTILYCIKKFEEVGINIELKNFEYSEYVNEYLTSLFREIDREDVNSKRIKDKFEEIYWKCPELIIHIVLNIKNIYSKNEKKIDKYFNNQRENLLKNFTADDIIERFMDLKKQLDKEVNENKASIVSKFLNGELDVKKFTNSAIIEDYAKFISKDKIDLENASKMDELDLNLSKLLNSIYEYKKYLKFKFVIDDIKAIYAEKDKYKNVYAKTKKEIDKKEKKRIALNKKINKKSIFKKNNEKFIDKRNEIILDLKQLYKELYDNKIYDKVITELHDNSNLNDVMNLASSFYEYLFNCICKTYKDMGEEEINLMIDEIKEFTKYPYSTIMNNIKILENKDIMIVIKDRYQMLDINILKEDLTEENLDIMIETLNKIQMAHNIRKNKINLDEIADACEFKKILNK